VSWRLVVHVLAGIAVAMALVDVTQAPMVFASIVAGVVVLVNVWNFMDGINGIATSQAAMVALAIALISPAARGAGLAVAAACLGFLPFNVPRARIFLGDVGSGALGLAMAWLIARAAVREARLDTALQSMLPASAFLVDASLTLARRVLRGERWWEPHTQHLYQGLARRHGHVPVTLGYVAWTGAMMLGMLAIGGASRPLIIASVLLCYTGATLLWLALQRQVAWKRGALGMRDT
jgi:UDP-N-acetylmuramyl pentapeptide phosphotransferase/UDP-N-acetylglucosamine-1-phosphate transferase